MREVNEESGVKTMTRLQASKNNDKIIRSTQSVDSGSLEEDILAHYGVK